MNVFRTIYERRELLANLVSRDLKSRYKGSALGFLWTLLTPLFMAVIYVFFLRMLVGRGVPTEEIIIGVFAWQYTMQCVNNGMSAITGNANLVKKVRFPRIILPVAAVLSNLVGYLLSLVVQFALVAALLAARGETLQPASVAVVGIIVFHSLFNLGLALLLSCANVFFRDTQHLVGVIVNAWFFVSPVMYNLSFVDQVARGAPWVSHSYLLNPLAVIITGYRALILPGAAFPWQTAAVGSVLAALAFVALSYVLFERLEKYFADML